MTTQATTWTTRNSSNAGNNNEVAFGRRITSRTTSNRHHSDRTATDNLGGEDNPDDNDHGNGSGPEGDPHGEPDDDPPDDDGPGDQPDDPDDPDDDVQNNLADAISVLARSVQHQGDGSRSKVREPDPFDGTDPTKLRTFLVQLQLSFNDRLAPLMMIVKKSTSQSRTSKALHLPTLRIHSLNQTWFIRQLGVMTTTNSSQSWRITLDPWTL